MSLRGHLRQSDPRQQALVQLRNQHPGSEIMPVSPDIRYLTLTLQDGHDNPAQALLNVDSWLETMNLHLPEIPWQEVPLSYLAHWLNQLQLSFLVEDKVWNAAQVAVSAPSLPELALSLPAEPTSLLCVDWPDDGVDGPHPQAITATHFPFQMKIVLGYSQINLAQLVDVAVGDLLLIKDVFTHLVVGQRRLYRLSYYLNQEVIVEEQLTAHDEMYRNDDEPLHDWANLAVEIEFVLDGKTVTLADLDTLRPGTTLALNPQAEQQIKIYLNKMLFARGELVALESGTLAVEVNHINPGLIGDMETPDAE
ncbi:FliM/FliN family flagellar motor switch protein [Klebsiella aerogenes]|uniref:FliM/FliN family flagellar motor switch protein n=1 Tax=Klebsiella aerogenes TaxID=548 RepID=UPI0005F0B891|nr:FliM/FliN family flagellar motor switch protein [Klebsiella aerogenes]ELA0209143.1 FliM/FliN family flagellar motor switch protein [Klebsiella aerogenes]ELA0230247.1 FliM/FliN family flagellar motor switch protein [Klebsiella aerogenes]KJO55862.1 type III secretion system protein [Klebsiella aerogenes]